MMRPDSKNESDAREVTDRYRLYARSHGRFPDAMLAQDRVEWPGGCMAGFSLWCSRMWRRWRAETGDGREGLQRHTEFDCWLEEIA